MAYIGIKPSDVAGAGQANITGSLTAGSATVTDDLIVDTNTLYVDSANNRVGIGTSSPTGKLDVYDTSAGLTSTKDLTGRIFRQDGTYNPRFEIRHSTEGTTLRHTYSTGANSLMFDIGTTERMRIIADGTVTTPYQPSFMVSKNADQTLVSGPGQNILTWETEVWDIGGNFASNTFTAPVTGKYYLHSGIRVDNFDTAAPYYTLRIVTSNRAKQLIIDPNFSSDPTYYTLNYGSIFHMDAGDTAYVSLIQYSGTASHIDDSEAYTSFSGYLLG